MPRYPILQVDAFTETPLAGNPCAVIFDADGLDDGEMLALAREMNLSETAFVMGSSQADYKARYFTPAEEIPFAGHPTIAVTHALIETGRLAVESGRHSLRLELSIGLITVDVQSRVGGAPLIVMNQPKPRFLATYTAAEVMPSFGLRAEDTLDGHPIRTVSTGTPQLMIPVRGLETLRRARLDIPSYQALKARGDFFSPHLFCLGGATEKGRTFARHFGVPPDTPEDPFTGSATGGMAAYLWRYELIDRPHFIAEQGHWMGRPGEAYVEVVGTRPAIRSIRVGGAAVTVFQGELAL
jgi:trans-2,3-dihydro-3-hydroxyanthranilate isomerase